MARSALSVCSRPLLTLAMRPTTCLNPPPPPTNKQNGTNRNETKTKRTAPPDQNSEAANARRFAALYCPLLPEIVVPEMYDSYTTAR